MWTPHFETNIEIIDEQHKELISMINKLLCAARDGTADALIDEMLVYLQRYVIEHFNTEENYMREYNYAGYAKHRQTHGEFLAEVQQLVDNHKMQVEDLDLAHYLTSRMTGWLADHFLGEDLKMAKFLKEAMENKQADMD